MITWCGKFIIEICAESGAASHLYNHLYQTESDNQYEGCYLGIKIYDGSHHEDLLLESAFIRQTIGSAVHQTSFIIEPDRLLTVFGDSVFCLAIPDLSLNWQIQADQAACFEILPFHKDYIVHGELEISRLSTNGEIIWQQSGADIFVGANSTREDFQLTDTYILATDWDGRKYKFDFDGKLID